MAWYVIGKKKGAPNPAKVLSGPHSSKPVALEHARSVKKQKGKDYSVGVTEKI